MQTVIFPGRYDCLAQIGEFVVNAAKSAGLNDANVYAVELAVDEACSNIIDHAYGGEGIGDVQCSVEINEGGFTVILHDRGRPFDPESVPTPQLNVPLDELQSRGIGFFLMGKMMDEIHYESSPETGNVLTMVKHK